MRLNRFLAQVGIASRRACDEIIESGKVSVDGTRVRTPGIRIIPGKQTVHVSGKRIDRPVRPIVLLLHKPTGTVSTVSDPQGRATVIDLCRRYARGNRLFPIGRLDVNTTGALLVTNDGLLCYRLTHPRFRVPKTYQVKVRGSFTDRTLTRMQRIAGSSKGKGEDDAVGRVEVVRQMGKVTTLRVTLYEGRNRQVRRMCEAVGLIVVKLKRLSFGPVSIRKLPLGAVRPLEKRELDALARMTGEA